MKLILVGMPGSGKSTVGKELSIRLDLPFIDLDQEIEKEEGKEITEIFRENGEDYFRKVESNALIKQLDSKGDFVLATGGGAPYFHNGMDIINKNGTSIFLDVSIEELVSRTEADKNRPLLQSGDKDELRNRLTNIRTKRLSCYQQAQITVQSSDVDDVLKLLDIRR